MCRAENVLKNVLMGKINKKCLFGRPRTRWKDIIEKDMILIDGNAALDWTLDKKNEETY